MQVSQGGGGNGIDKQASVFDDDYALIGRAEEYIRTCGEETIGAKQRARFPNLAGFCRFLGVGVETFEGEMAAHPEVADVIRAMLEDEALNSDMAATLLSSYLKKRLGYGDPTEPKHAACDTGDMKIVFEHDVYEDGG